MSAKPAPRFGGGGEQCKTCSKTVYPNERISYDSGTWHQLCFKCIQCRSTLSLTAVAMIGGDLYCKTCFKKIFLREGKYSTFEAQKSLPKDVAAELTHAASMDAPDSDKQPSPPVSRAASDITATSNTKATRSPSPSIATQPPQTPLAALQAAIERKDQSACQSLLAAHGAALLFEPVKGGGVSVLEWALTSYMHKAVGGRMVEWLGGRVGEANSVMRQHGLVSPLDGTQAGLGQGQKGSGGQVEETKESTEAETNSSSAATEANEVGGTA